MIGTLLFASAFGTKGLVRPRFWNQDISTCLLVLQYGKAASPWDTGRSSRFAECDFVSCTANRSRPLANFMIGYLLFCLPGKSAT